MRIRALHARCRHPLLRLTGHSTRSVRCCRLRTLRRRAMSATPLVSRPGDVKSLVTPDLSSIDPTALHTVTMPTPEPTNHVPSHRYPPRLAADGRFNGAIMLRLPLFILKPLGSRRKSCLKPYYRGGYQPHPLNHPCRLRPSPDIIGTKTVAPLDEPSY
jgi:hypothetical protein